MYFFHTSCLKSSLILLSRTYFNVQYSLVYTTKLVSVELTIDKKYHIIPIYLNFSRIKLTKGNLTLAQPQFFEFYCIK